MDAIMSSIMNSAPTKIVKGLVDCARNSTASRRTSFSLFGSDGKRLANQCGYVDLDAQEMGSLMGLAMAVDLARCSMVDRSWLETSRSMLVLNNSAHSS